VSLDRRLLAAVLCALGLLAGGCGGDDGPSRSAAAERLAVLCAEARLDVEALGLPSERGIVVIRPWANRGTRLSQAIGRLEGGIARERSLLESLAKALDEYYAGLRVGLLVYEQTRSFDAYAAAIERGTAFLEESESLARRLDAPECAVRPFADDG